MVARADVRATGGEVFPGGDEVPATGGEVFLPRDEVRAPGAEVFLPRGEVFSVKIPRVGGSCAPPGRAAFPIYPGG